MKLIKNQTYDAERAFYGQAGVHFKDGALDGPADGESAFKECSDIVIENVFCNLRYPFWHNHGLKIIDSELTDLCRAALWYTDHVEITNTKLHGIKALRECADIVIDHCSIDSAEFGWFSNNIEISNSTVKSEYFMMQARNLTLKKVKFDGKYSFQYNQNLTIEDSELTTKDAFWHAKNVTVKNSTLRGEYLAWFSEGLTLINCKIIGTQPLCYCKDLTLIDCEMIDSDLSFEKSDVDATILTSVDSIKNPLSGTIRVPEVGEIIRDEKWALGEIVITKDSSKSL